MSLSPILQEEALTRDSPPFFPFFPPSLLPISLDHLPLTDLLCFCATVTHLSQPPPSSPPSSKTPKQQTSTSPVSQRETLTSPSSVRRPRRLGRC